MSSSSDGLRIDTEAQVDESRQRVSRFERVSSPASIRIQARDLAILEALYSYRMLTTSQLTSLFFTTKKRAEQRLRKLFDAELVERIFRPVVLGSAEVIYILDKVGVSLLAQESALDRDDIEATRVKARAFKPLFLDHLLAVNQFRVSVALACKIHGYSMLFWKYEHELQNRNDQGVLIADRVVDSENPSQQIPIVPDGFFGLEIPQGRVFFFLEVDRATTGNRFRRKIRGYTRYYLDGVYQEKWGYKAFRVLTTTTPKRLPNLVKMASQIPEKRLSLMFCFTEQDNINPEQVLGGIWIIPNQKERQNLV